MKNTIKIINKLKKEGLIKDYAIGGAIGVIRWTEPFFTRDLDLFIILIQEPKDKEIIFLYPIYDYLEKIGYNKWTGQWIIVAGVPVEFIPAEGLSKEAVENAQETEYDGVKTKVITPEYLISLLLKAGRDKDKIKIKMLLEQEKIDMDKLKVILNKYNLNKKFQLFIND